MQGSGVEITRISRRRGHPWFPSIGILEQPPMASDSGLFMRIVLQLTLTFLRTIHPGAGAGAGEARLAFWFAATFCCIPCARVILLSR